MRFRLLDLVASLADAHHQDAEGCVKTKADLDRYRAVIHKVKPRLILETGIFSGKSAKWFAQVAGCKVISVDIDHRNIDDDTRRTAEAAGVEFLLGRSTSPNVIAHMVAAARAADGPVMVSLDGDHSAETVYAELLEYGLLVSVGSYMVCEDGLVRYMPEQMKPHGPYTGNPLDAIERYLSSRSKRWEVDLEIENMHPATQFPSGFLKRIG